MILGRLLSLFKNYSKKEKNLRAKLRRIVGGNPLNLALYKLALQHSSVAKKTRRGTKLSNERLEFLGDAILDMVVADYLFKKFPYKNEGFLTEIRSRIVNRDALNQVAIKIGINKIMAFDENRKSKFSHKSIFGNTLEALVGAIYLDRGFKFSKRFILKKILEPHFDLEVIVKENPNYKSRIIEWAQKENRDLRFEIVEIKERKQFKEFTAQVFIEDEPVSKGHGTSKKKAEQDAAQKSIEKLNLEDYIAV